MRSVKIMYQDGTAIVIEQSSETEELKPREAKAEGEGDAGRPGGKQPEPKEGEGKSDPKMSQPEDDDDWSYILSARAPRDWKVTRVESLDAMIDHLSRRRPIGSSSPADRLTYAVKLKKLDPSGARQIFERLPDEAHVTILRDEDA